MLIVIIYSPPCGFEPVATSLAKKIKDALNVEPILTHGARTIFEVWIDDVLVYSRFRSGKLPDEDEFVGELRTIYGR